MSQEHTALHEHPKIVWYCRLVDRVLTVSILEIEPYCPTIRYRGVVNACGFARAQRSVRPF